MFPFKVGGETKEKLKGVNNKLAFIRWALTRIQMNTDVARFPLDVQIRNCLPITYKVIYQCCVWVLTLVTSK